MCRGIWACWAPSFLNHSSCGQHKRQSPFLCPDRGGLKNCREEYSRPYCGTLAHQQKFASDFLEPKPCKRLPSIITTVRPRHVSPLSHGSEMCFLEAGVQGSGLPGWLRDLGYAHGLQGGSYRAILQPSDCQGVGVCSVSNLDAHGQKIKALGTIATPSCHPRSAGSVASRRAKATKKTTEIPARGVPLHSSQVCQFLAVHSDRQYCKQQTFVSRAARVRARESLRLCM